MNTKKWTIGFIVAIVFGLLTAGAGLAAGMGWQAFIAVLCTSLVTQLGGYLMKHPIDEIEDENEGRERGTSKDNTVPPFRPPVWLIAFLLAGAVVGCATYKQVGVVAVTAEKAMQSYAHYYDAAIANPPAFKTTQAKLWKQRIEVDKSWETYRTAMNAVDDARQAGGDVKAALQVASAYSGQFVALVLQFLPVTNQPKPQGTP